MIRSNWLPVTAGALVIVVFLAAAVFAKDAAAERPTPPVPPHVVSTVKLPEVIGNGVVRTVESSGHTIKLDLSGQVLRLEAPKQDEWREPGDVRPSDTVKATRKTRLMRGRDSLAEIRSGQLLPVIERKDEWVRTAAGGQLGWVNMKDVQLQSTEPAISPTLREVTDYRTVSYAAIAQKCKQFDDGLYAAVELAAQQGQGEFSGKKRLLAELAKAVLSSTTAADSNEGAIVLGASSIARVQPMMPSGVKRRVDALLADFQSNPLRSKPIGFYTWNNDLRTIFQQDRLLQAEMKPGAGTEAILAAFDRNPELRQTYERYLQLISRLTNPLAAPNLRSLSDSAAADQPTAVHFFPPSVAHETELIKRLYGNRPIPDDFSLADEMVTQIKSGKIDLTPKKDSGWYDFQTWSLEPLLLPERTPEAKHLQLGDEYRKLLVELFKGVLALTRETHVKQLEFPPAAAEAPPVEEKVKFYISPELSVEPLATAYLRRALAYQFVRQVIVDAFGGVELSKLHRSHASGPMELALDKELEVMESLLHGAYTTATRQLGMPAGEDAAQLQRDGKADAAAYLDWAANLGRDADLGQDARMMVPVFYDVMRKKTKVWAFLGWAPRGVSMGFAKGPKIDSIRTKEDKEVAEKDVELHYFDSYENLIYPVVAEVYVTKILDRDEFRRHCDLYKTRSAILSNLE